MNLFIPPPKVSSAPIFVTTVAHEIRSIGATLWLIQKTDFGFLLRCERNKKTFRVIVPPLKTSSLEIPYEKGSPLFVVTTIDELRAWLQSIKAEISAHSAHKNG